MKGSTCCFVDVSTTTTSENISLSDRIHSLEYKLDKPLSKLSYASAFQHVTPPCDKATSSAHTPYHISKNISLHPVHLTQRTHRTLKNANLHSGCRLTPSLRLDATTSTTKSSGRSGCNAYSQDATQMQHLFSGLNPDALLRVPPLHIPDLGHNLFRESIEIVY